MLTKPESRVLTPRHFLRTRYPGPRLRSFVGRRAPAIETRKTAMR